MRFRTMLRSARFDKGLGLAMTLVDRRPKLDCAPGRERRQVWPIKMHTSNEYNYQLSGPELNSCFTEEEAN